MGFKTEVQRHKEEVAGESSCICLTRVVSVGDPTCSPYCPAQPPAAPQGVTQSQINIVRRERSDPGSDSQPKSGRRKIRRNLSPDVAT